MAAAAVCWSAIGPLATELFERGVSPNAVGFWRASVGGACFVIHARLTGRLAAPPPSARPGTLAFAAIGIALFYVSVPQAVEAGGVGLAIVLLYAAPALVALAAPRVLGTPVRTSTLILVGVTGVGVALSVLPAGGSAPDPQMAALWGLTSAVCYSSHYLLMPRLLVGADAGRGAVAVYARALPLGAIMLAPFASWGDGEPLTLLMALAVGVVPTWLAFWALGRGLASVAPARAAVIATLEPVLGVLLGVLLYEEPLTALGLIGGVLVVAAATAAGRRA